MMRSIHIEPITAEAFAPYGQLLLAPATGGPRFELIQELQNLRSAAKPRLSLAAVAPKVLPLTVIQMERHKFSSQAFVPYDCAGYLILVAPHGVEGMPDIDRLRAFHVPGDIGVNYRADTWHHPLTALESPARFVVLTFIEGTQTDEEFVSLNEPISIIG